MRSEPNVPPGPQPCLECSWDSAPSYSPWFAHIAHRSSSSPSLEPSPSIFSAYVAVSCSMDFRLIFCRQAVGPLYPFANYKILNSILIAASSYCAIALVCCFVIYPETVNHAYLGLISVMLAKVKAMLVSQEDLLSIQPGDFGIGCPKLKALIATRVAVMGMYQNCNYPSYHLRLLFTHSSLVRGLTIHLQSEFSVGRWSGDDALGLADPLLAVVARISTH